MLEPSRENQGRFNQVMERRFCDFPEGALEEILSWLPPQSLMGFKCVCKSWYGLINSLVKNSVFVNKHLRNIDKIFCPPSCLVFRCSRPGYGPFDLLSSITISDADCESAQLELIIEDFDMPGILGKRVIRVCHCDGLVCLADSDGTLTLFNHAIKEYRALPEPCHAEDDYTTIGVGFGNDSRANDYKVVKLRADERFLLDKLEQLPLIAEVYSLKTDSWRDIEIHMQFDGLPFADAVFCQGVLYWCIWDPQKYMIFSFDMYDEVFHRIPCPDTYDEVLLHMPFPDNLLATPGKENRLVVWNDSVALLYYPYLRGAPFVLEVWVLNDCIGGVKGSCSWIKKLSIGPLDGIVTAWTFWKNDELLLGATGGRLVSYNLCSQMLRNHTIQGARIPRRWEFSCVKSLVSVQGGIQAR